MPWIKLGSWALIAVGFGAGLRAPHREIWPPSSIQGQQPSAEVEKAALGLLASYLTSQLLQLRNHRQEMAASAKKLSGHACRRQASETSGNFGEPSGASSEVTALAAQDEISGASNLTADICAGGGDALFLHNCREWAWAQESHLVACSVAVQTALRQLCD